MKYKQLDANAADAQPGIQSHVYYVYQVHGGVTSLQGEITQERWCSHQVRTSLNQVPFRDLIPWFPALGSTALCLVEHPSRYGPYILNQPKGSPSVEI